MSKDILDLSWGHPDYMTPYWKNVDLRYYEPKKFDSTLQYRIGTGKDVQTAIKALHIDQNNANVENKRVVVGTGATQIIRAVINLLGEKVYAEPPYFSRFPTLAKKENLKWGFKNHETILLTVPNNPDGREDHQFDSEALYKVYDLCYNWPQYTNTYCFNEPIMIFSMAKATGHASSRVGWLITDDDAFADAVEDYIEVDTGGISIDSEKKLLSIINHQLSAKKTIFEYGKDILNKRWKILNNIKTKFEILNKQGMFLWCKGEIPEGVLGMTGDNFGASKNHFRLNIGCSEETFDAFIEKVKQ